MKYKSSSDPVSSIQLHEADGYRFQPTHEQLISNYLIPKARGSKVKDLQLIAEVKLCKHEPWDLPDMSVIKSDDEEWYFFCPIDKYFNSQSRSNRKTKAGYWKPTGKKRPILAKGTKKEIGIRKSLVFYEKAGPKQKAVRTGWIITEYEITNSGLSDKGGYFLCKLKKSSVDKTKKGEQNHHVASVADLEAEHSVASAFENQNPSEISVNSAPDGSELSNHEGSDFQNQHSNELLINSAHEVSESSHYLASDFENQNSNDLTPNSGYLGSELYLNLPMDSDFENQNSNELKQAHEVRESSHYLASDYEIQISNDHMPDSACAIISGLDLPINSDFDNQDSEKLTVDSAFNWSKCLIDCGNECPNELKVDSAYNGSQSQFMAFGFENQYPNDPRVNSACNGNKSHYSAFDYGNQYPNKLKVDSAYDGSRSMAFGSGNQYPNELIANSACNGSKSHYMAFDCGNQDPSNLTTESDYSGSKSQFMTFDSENQNSFKIVATSSYENQLVNPVGESCPSRYCTSDKSETSSMASCSENQNPDKEIYISGFDEDDYWSHLTSPSGFANKNPCKETDMSTIGEDYLSDSTAWFPENNVADAASPELIIPEILAEAAEFFGTTKQP